MFCSKCGKELENDARFCNSCGIELKKEISEESMIEASKSPKVKKSSLLLKMVIIVMSILIVAMGSYIAVDIIGNNDAQVC